MIEQKYSCDLIIGIEKASIIGKCLEKGRQKERKTKQNEKKPKQIKTNKGRKKSPTGENVLFDWRRVNASIGND